MNVNESAITFMNLNIDSKSISKYYSELKETPSSTNSYLIFMLNFNCAKERDLINARRHLTLF